MSPPSRSSTWFRREGAGLFGVAAREFRKHASPLPRQKRMASDFQVLERLMEEDK